MSNVHFSKDIITFQFFFLYVSAWKSFDSLQKEIKKNSKWFTMSLLK